MPSDRKTRVPSAAREKTMSTRNGMSGNAEDARLADDAWLYRQEASRLRRFFRMRLGRTEEVGDLVQEAFARLAGRPFQDPLANPAAYLQRIARNLLVDRARRRVTSPPPLSLDDEDCPETPVPPSQDQEIEARQLMDAYERAVAALPPRTREVFVLHRVGELSYHDIAARLAISVRTVEWHIGDALLRVRRALDGG